MNLLSVYSSPSSLLPLSSSSSSLPLLLTYRHRLLIQKFHPNQHYPPFYHHHRHHYCLIIKMFISRQNEHIEGTKSKNITNYTNMYCISVLCKQFISHSTAMQWHRYLIGKVCSMNYRRYVVRFIDQLLQDTCLSSKLLIINKSCLA